LVIGGTGFIGPAVIRRLAGSGHNVTVFRGGVMQASLPGGVQELIGDRRRLPQFEGEFRRVERVALSDPALPATVLRLPMVYGWGDAYHRFFPYIRRMEDRRPAILLDEATGNWRSTWGYVDNDASAIALAAENPDSAGQIYNVSDACRPSMADWVREVMEVTGWSGILKIVRVACPPPSFGPETNAHQHLVCDSAKIRDDLGYGEVVSHREAIERKVSWEREHPLREIDAKQFDYAAEDRILEEIA